MMKIIQAYVKYTDTLCWWIGRFAMYLIFVMIAILLYSAVSKSFSVPAIWTLEFSQFLMVAYFILGGPYSMQLGEHVRMDLLYAEWSDKTRYRIECMTIFCLLVYISILLYGSVSSTLYAIEFGERNYSAWRPYMWPIKVIITVGIFLMLLQTLSIFCKMLIQKHVDVEERDV